MKLNFIFIYKIICYFLTFAVSKEDEYASGQSTCSLAYVKVSEFGKKTAMFFFWSAIILSPLQIFIIQVRGKYLPISYLCALALIPFIPAVIANFRKNKLLLIFGSVYALLIFFQLLSLFWSIAIINGVLEILRELPFLCILLFAGGRWDWIKRSFDKRLTVLTIIMLACAMLIILFRLFPGIEINFLTNEIAKLLINPKSLLIIHTGCNALDPAKAGGVFLNANTAAMHLALYFWVIVNRMLHKNSNSYIISIVILLAAIALSGSKATFLLMLAALILMIVIKCRPKLFAGLTFLLCILFCTNNPYVLRLQGNSYSSVSHSWFGGDRIKLYHLSFKLISESPVLGLGFGGWEKSFSKEKNNFNFGGNIVPPHNAYLFNYLQSGFLAFLLSISLPIIFVYQLYYRFFNDKGSLYLIISLGIGGSIVFVQAAIKNGLWGELHITPLLALAVVLLNKPEGMYDSANK